MQHPVTFHYRYLCQTGNPKLSPDIGQNSDGSISNFWISDQSLLKKNCKNSRASDDIDMKLGPVTKLEKRKKTTSKKFDNNVMSANCDNIIIFPIYGQFGAIQSWIPVAWSVKLIFPLTVTIILQKLKTKLKNL